MWLLSRTEYIDKQLKLRRVTASWSYEESPSHMIVYSSHAILLQLFLNIKLKILHIAVYFYFQNPWGQATE